MAHHECADAAASDQVEFVFEWARLAIEQADVASAAEMSLGKVDGGVIGKSFVPAGVDVIGVKVREDCIGD